jgi:hypothetical protein
VQRRQVSNGPQGGIVHYKTVEWVDSGIVNFGRLSTLQDHERELVVREVLAWLDQVRVCWSVVPWGGAAEVVREVMAGPAGRNAVTWVCSHLRNPWTCWQRCSATSQHQEVVCLIGHSREYMCRTCHRCIVYPPPYLSGLACAKNCPSLPTSPPAAGCYSPTAAARSTRQYACIVFAVRGLNCNIEMFTQLCTLPEFLGSP